jgi:ferredoxin
MKATVDEDLCRGHGSCCAVCPDVFALNDDGYATVQVTVVPAHLEADARLAANRCPERAITTD